ncbi:MAG: class II fructose-bisphosphate aldolase [Ruminococcaceae bacterium]|nr:class II fructose-bisphosphate aldolase [Oscillospiraceae bacterium]
MIVNLNDVLKKAQEGHYAVGLFNTTDTDMAEAVIAAAEEMNSPVVIGTAEILLPYGELKLIAPSLRALAERAKVPVVLHYDHGLTFDRCIEALKLGFSSIMFDGSLGESDKNIEETREIVKIAHSFGASVEGEIGHVGNAIDGDGVEDDMYTTPEEAVNFVKDTGVDALAVAIGTAHGVYKTKPKLDLERLKAIRKACDTPLVLHGGSGLSDDDFRNSIRDGIAKVNIFTDLCVAGAKAMEEGIKEGKGYLEIRNMKVEEIKKCVINKMKLFGSENKA